MAFVNQGKRLLRAIKVLGLDLVSAKPSQDTAADGNDDSARKHALVVVVRLLHPSAMLEAKVRKPGILELGVYAADTRCKKLDRRTMAGAAL